ncbi:MAG TPA: TfoX/Sxy family protein [Candidatus Dormibacteraeota bacterium]|nr:TfoX/Sxy family protein [Candidatus Dormibacteraeota bacterium]
MQGGGMPKSSAEAKAAFQSLVPAHPSVTTRPMFGNLAAFVNGNMFTGLFGDDLFVRVSDDDRARLLEQGGTDFAPMPGRAMKGYVVLPPGWSERAEATRGWIDRSLESAQGLPTKEKKPRR